MLTVGFTAQEKELIVDTLMMPRPGVSMEVLVPLCKNGTCNRECVDACRSIHGEDAPLSFSVSKGYPVIDEAKCTECLSCIRSCPYGAITNIHLHNRKKHQKTRLRASTPQNKPYEISEDYSRFSESNMIFARVRNDSSFEHYGKDEWHGAEAMIESNIEGYGRFEHELAVANWHLYDARTLVTGVPQEEITRPKRNRTIQAAPAELALAIKRAARFIGADLVGIAQLDRRWLYSEDRKGNQYDIPEGFNRAIVMAIEMDYESIATSPSFTSSAATALGYSQMAFLEIELAAFIRRLGYSAVSCGNDVGLSVPLAIDAGLGGYGRHGLLITKKYGPRVRLAKVFTDMPLEPDQPDTKFAESVIRFCEVCEKCAEHCPSQSIPFGPERTITGETKSNNPGVKKWYINPETCYGFWIENGSECSNCLRSCPYNKEDGLLHRLILWIVENMPWMNSLIVKMDDIVGYGKQKPPSSAWARYDKTS
ncbi:reductive dehalogenase [Candidatus Thorarchaeota archaeon]|nr:MAG: reductive dehalogenase [Candidatus Thorarchaeota archaeon]